MSNAIKQAYELGWRRSAEWSKRDDLLSDIGSPAYKRDRAEDLAHLSAQAKVRVEEMVEAIIFHPFGSTTLGNIICAEISGDRLSQELANALKPFAARLSQGVQSSGNSGELANVQQGAQGEALTDEAMRAEWREAGGAIHGPNVETVTMPEANYFKLRRTFAAERAAAPNGWEDLLIAVREVLSQSEPTREVLRHFPTYRDRHAHVLNAVRDALTAAPQPPEGARVVDGWQTIESAPTDGTLHVRGLWVRTPRGSYFDAVVGGINDEGQFVDLDHDSTRWDASDYTHWHRLSAAPTLAGKEG